MPEQIKIKTEYITLGQFLKLANVFESGGMIKGYIQNEGVLVNGELDNRRGRKLYPEDVIVIDEAGTFIVKNENTK